MRPPSSSPIPSRRLLLQASLLGLAGLFGPPAQAQAIVRPWPASRAVPPLGLAQMEGGTRQLAHWRGRVLVLNFWASWCEPCVSELPSLLRLAEGQAQRGLSVALVNYQEGEAKVKDFLDLVFGEIPEALPVLMDRDGAVAKAWTPRVLPTTVLVDRKGQPRWSVIGELDWTGPQARELIEPLLSQGR